MRIPYDFNIREVDNAGVVFQQRLTPFDDLHGHVFSRNDNNEHVMKNPQHVTVTALALVSHAGDMRDDRITGEGRHDYRMLPFLLTVTESFPTAEPARRLGRSRHAHRYLRCQHESFARRRD